MNSGALRAILADAPRSENFGCGGVENSVLPRSFLNYSLRAPYSEKKQTCSGRSAPYSARNSGGVRGPPNRCHVMCFWGILTVFGGQIFVT